MVAGASEQCRMNQNDSWPASSCSDSFILLPPFSCLFFRSDQTTTVVASRRAKHVLNETNDWSLCRARFEPGCSGRDFKQRLPTECRRASGPGESTVADLLRRQGTWSRQAHRPDRGGSGIPQRVLDADAGEALGEASWISLHRPLQFEQGQRCRSHAKDSLGGQDGHSQHSRTRTFGEVRSRDLI